MMDAPDVDDAEIEVWSKSSPGQSETIEWKLESILL